MCSMFCFARILGALESVRGFLHPQITVHPVSKSPARSSALVFTSLATLAAAGALSATGHLFWSFRHSFGAAGRPRMGLARCAASWRSGVVYLPDGSRYNQTSPISNLNSRSLLCIIYLVRKVTLRAERVYFHCTKEIVQVKHR